MAFQSSAARGAGNVRIPIPEGRLALAGQPPEAQVRAATLLRTHTSAIRIRYMKTFPPVRIIVPGPVYRRGLDLTHTPMFQQFEGLVVGEGITMANPRRDVRSHASPPLRSRESAVASELLPLSEPSAEVDISCKAATARAAASASGRCTLEILGSGMVHPALFEAVGYDPEKVTRTPFGLGLEHVAMLKLGVGGNGYTRTSMLLEQFPVP